MDVCPPVWQAHTMQVQGAGTGGGCLVAWLLVRQPWQLEFGTLAGHLKGNATGVHLHSIARQFCRLCRLVCFIYSTKQADRPCVCDDSLVAYTGFDLLSASVKRLKPQLACPCAEAAGVRYEGILIYTVAKVTVIHSHIIL